ncbi:hypothetical protein [Streptomyces sp. CB03234]|uniref:hypothetical protein n=1 Tax=Streptomyces sp. (strain CB03234) TaxID=1703937 RepID=UPI00117E3317|nr:hypothetical protein [Streptomyces sp. CB03234]
MKKPLLACLAAVLTAAVATGGYLALQHVTDPSEPVRTVTASYDPGAARDVASSADDVFHGTVVRLTGRRTIAEIPSRLYEVRVGHVFKGGLTGTVTLTQPEGHPTLEPGGKYVFATTSWHNEDNEHGLLSGTRPYPAPDLTAPVLGTPARAGVTVAEYWRDAVDGRTGSSR